MIDNGNQIYFNNSNNYNRYSTYDKNNNRIHYKDSNDYEEWFKYDKNGNKLITS